MCLEFIYLFSFPIHRAVATLTMYYVASPLCSLRQVAKPLVSIFPFNGSVCLSLRERVDIVAWLPTVCMLLMLFWHSQTHVRCCAGAALGGHAFVFARCL